MCSVNMRFLVDCYSSNTFGKPFLQERTCQTVASVLAFGIQIYKVSNFLHFFKLLISFLYHGRKTARSRRTDLRVRGFGWGNTTSGNSLHGFSLNENSKLILYNNRLKDTSKIARGSWDLQSQNISTALRQQRNRTRLQRLQQLHLQLRSLHQHLPACLHRHLQRKHRRKSSPH